MKKSIANAAILATAVSLMFAGSTAMAGEQGNSGTQAQVKCIGGNACKCQSACKTATSSCKGQNSCKGKGYVMTSTVKECEAPRAQSMRAGPGDPSRRASRADWSPAGRLLALEHRVERVLAAVERNEEWGPPAREPSPTLVWRNRSMVFYRVLQAPEFEALDAAHSGATFAEICGRFAAAATAGDAASEINRNLSRWLGDGLLILAGA